MKDAVLVIELLLRKFISWFRRFSRRTWRVAIDLAESRPITIRLARGDEHVISTGFWCGILDVYPEKHNKLVEIVITPRISRYDAMIESVEEVLAPISRDFELLLKSTAYARIGQPLIPYLEPLIHVAQTLTMREPKRICRVKEIVPKKNLLFIPVGYELICVDNRGLKLLLAMILKSISQALNSLAMYIDDLKSYAKSNGFKGLEALTNIVERYRIGIVRLLESLAPTIESIDIQSLDEDAVEQLSKYVDIVAALKRFSRLTRVLGMGFAKGFAYPSTKLYELYAYTNIVQALGPIERARYRRYLAVEVDGKRAYFNHVPPKYSRIVRPLSGKRPRPDMVVSMDRKIVVLDAKYRELDGKKLSLADALRLAGYLADVARNGVLQAGVVALRCPRDMLVTMEIDGKFVEIHCIELNPDRSVGRNMVRNVLEK